VIAACRPLVLQQQKISSRSICMTFPRPISINKGHRSSPSSRWVSSSSPHKSQSLPQDKEDKEFSSNSDSGARSSEESVKEQILEAALNHVNSQGWNVNAISQGNGNDNVNTRLYYCPGFVNRVLCLMSINPYYCQ